MSALGTTRVPDHIRAQGVALAELSGNQKWAADQIGVARQTLNDFTREPKTRRLAADVKKQLGYLSLEVAAEAALRLRETLPQANTRDAAGAYKLLVDGGLLALGQPTQIVATPTELAALAVDRYHSYRALADSDSQALEWLHDDAPEFVDALPPALLLSAASVPDSSLDSEMTGVPDFAPTTRGLASIGAIDSDSGAISAGIAAK